MRPWPVAALLLVCHATSAAARPAAQPALSKVASALRRALPAAAAPSLVPALPALRRGDAEVLVELRFTALPSSVAARAVALGARIEHLSERYARLVATVPLAALPALAALPGLTTIHPLYGGQTATGVVDSQVAAALAIDAARARFAVDGTGVRIGLLSDTIANAQGGRLIGSGCERLLTDSAPQSSGDLPEQIAVIDLGRSGADEGAAMGEIIHDLAPGAALLFASAFPDEATFAENIAALRACGADIIADDVLFYAEPMFQDGIVSQAATAAVADGALFFSAAANSGDAGIDQFYRDVDDGDERSEPPTGVDLHDFGAGAGYTAVTVPSRCELRFILQWNEPFSGTLGPGARSDLDLYVYAAPTPAAPILASSTDTQGCANEDESGPSGDPLEIAVFRNNSAAPRTVYVAIDHFCGDETVHLRLVALGGNCVQGFDDIRLERGPFGGPAIFGHPMADGVLAIAAVDQREVLSAGAFSGLPSVIDVEAFSSLGGALPVYFDVDGTPFSGGPRVRLKPELAAPDGGDTTFFGRDVDGTGFPNFFGTSAAAPAAAAVAALLLEAAPERGRAAVVDALRAAARDIAMPGRDPAAGDGLIDPEGALEALLATPTGDCNGDRRVTIDELVIGVRIALATEPPDACPALDDDGDGTVTIAELISAVNAALS